MKRILPLGCIFLLILFPMLGCGDDSSQTQAPSCTPKYVYDQVKDGGEALEVLDFESAYNGTANNADFTLTATHSASVSISRSDTQIQKFHAEVKGEAPILTGNAFVPVAVVQANAIYDSIHQQTESVSKTMTSTTGSNIRLTIPPMSKGYGIYGVVVKITSGHLYSQNCTNHDDVGNISTIIPEHFDWCTWTRGPTLFTEGGQGPCLVVAYNL